MGIEVNAIQRELPCGNRDGHLLHSSRIPRKQDVLLSYDTDAVADEYGVLESGWGVEDCGGLGGWWCFHYCGGVDGWVMAMGSDLERET
jgi:hypothetical protein